MFSLYILNTLLIAHFVADYLFQNRWCTEKNNSLLWMMLHSIIYTVVFGVIVYAVMYKSYEYNHIASFVIINGFLHYAVDLLTGVIKRLQYEQDYIKMNHDGFYATMGFDQLLHILIITHTFNYMFL